MGVREEKKAKLRKFITENAWKLFSQFGFENVKVKDIADASGISVKTLFQYFDSKEDLIFENQYELLEDILKILKATKDPKNYLPNLKESMLSEFMNSDHTLKSKDTTALINMLVENPSISGRLHKLWLSYEHEILNYLVSITPDPNYAKLSTISAKIMLPYRLLIDYMIQLLRSQGEIDVKQLITWLEDVFYIL